MIVVVEVRVAEAAVAVISKKIGVIMIVVVEVRVAEATVAAKRVP